MFFKTCATLALAIGSIVAKPVSHPRVRDVAQTPNKRSLGNGGFNFIDGFNNFNNQQQVIQIQEQNLQIVDNGFQQQVVQQANEVLIVNNQQNGFNNDLNNLFRKSNFNNQFQDQSTVVLMVQEIQIAVDDGFGNSFEQQVFAQSAIVANRGQQATQTLMVFASETLVAQDILGGVGGFDKFQQDFGQQGFNNNIAAPQATQGVQLFGEKPSWSQIAEDPAAKLGGIWEKELQDAQDVNQNGNDNALNDQAAAEEKAALDQAKADQEAQDQQNQEEQAAEGEDQAAEGEQAAAEASATASEAAEATASAAAEKH